MKSKIYITILIVMIIFLSISVSNFKSIASTSANIVVDTKNVVQGNEVEVNINLQNSVDFSAANFTLTYDSSILKYTDFEIGNSLKNSDGTTNGTIVFNTNTSGEIRMGYMLDSEKKTETKTAGKLFTITFKVKSGAGTSTDIKLEATTLKKGDGTDVSTNITDGKLRIISGIQMNTSSLTLEKMTTSNLLISTLPTSIDISNETITWDSSDTSIATVDSNGLVTAVGLGTTEITATVLGLSAKCTVTVINDFTITLDKEILTLPSGQIRKLTVTSSESLEDKNVAWSSSDKTVATVDTNGLVTALKEGTTTITVTAGEKTTTCRVTVSGQLGDVDKDGNITAYDAYKALETSVDYLIGTEINEQIILTSDANKNGIPESEDAYKILQYSVGIINEF